MWILDVTVLSFWTILKEKCELKGDLIKRMLPTWFTVVTEASR